MKDVITPPSNKDPSSFVLLYQEPVGVAANAGGTHTLTREDPDYLQSHTRTDARESDDTDMTAAHATFPSSAIQTLTKTGAREQDDTALTTSHRVFSLETVTTA